MRVLIVESEVVVARAMACALESRGHQVDVAAHVEIALALGFPDALIADPELSGLSGLDLLEQYHRQGHRPRAVFITSTPSLESCQRALRLGASEFLSKPFRLDDLIQAVELEDHRPQSLFERSYECHEGVITTVQRDVAAFALRHGISPTCRARCSTAIGELVENVQRHAYPLSSGEFRITATLDPRELIVTVVDEGVGLDPSDVAVEHLSVQGGLARAAALAERIDIRRNGTQGAAITLHFGASLVDYGGDQLADFTEHDFLSPETAREILATLACDGGANFFQLPPSLAVVIGRLLAAPNPQRSSAQALRS